MRDNRDADEARRAPATREADQIGTCAMSEPKASTTWMNYALKATTARSTDHITAPVVMRRKVLQSPTRVANDVRACTTAANCGLAMNSDPAKADDCICGPTRDANEVPRVSATRYADEARLGSAI